MDVYKITNNFPKEEKFKLGDQLRRSASSVPTNIVEGNSRAHKKEHIQFLYLAKDLGYLKQKVYEDLNIKGVDIGRMISGLIKHLKS